MDVSEYSVWCLLEQGGSIATDQDVRARDHQHSFGVQLELGGSKQICDQGQSCSGGLLPSPRAIFCSSHNLPPVSFLPPLVSYMVWPVEPGLTIVLGPLGLPPNGQRQGDGRQCVGRGHRLEDKLRALGHCPVQGPLMALTIGSP